MSTAAARTQTHPLLSASLGLPAKAAATGAMAGGILTGGVLVATLTYFGRLSGFALFFTSSSLFLIGALLGFAHGAVLGVVGREEGQTVRQAWTSVLHGALFAILGIAVSWLLTVWVALSVPALHMGQTRTLAFVGVAWFAAAAVLLLAARHAFRAFMNATVRWQDRRVGFALFVVGAASLTALMTAGQPLLWGLRFNPPLPTAIVLSLIGSFWLVGPMLTAGLTARRWLVDHAVRPDPKLNLGDVPLAALVGLVAGAIALPFANVGGAIAGGQSALGLALGQVFFNEVIFRVGLVTIAAAVFYRWQRSAGRAAAFAVIFAAVVQVLAYLPGAVQVGFPSLGGAALFLGGAVLVPALLFGALYWRRGLVPVFVADAVAVLLLIFVAV